VVKAVPDHCCSHWSKNFDCNRSKFRIGFTERRVRPKFIEIGLFSFIFTKKKILQVASLPLQNSVRNLGGTGCSFTCIFNTFPNFSKMDKLTYRISYFLHSTWEGTFWKSFRTVSLAILITACLLSSLHARSALISEFTDLHKEAVLL